MEKKLNIETFNEILFNALKDKSSKVKLLEIELQTAYSKKIQAMEALVDILNQKEGYTRQAAEALKVVNNIDNSCDMIGELLDKAREELSDED